jgi:hypothetical protein
VGRAEQPERIRLVVEVGQAELAHISLALDYFIHSPQNTMADFRKTQQRWDKLYRSVHDLPGVRSIIFNPPSTA